MNFGIFKELELKEEALKAVEAREKRLNNALETVLSTEDGRRVFRWILGLTDHDKTVTCSEPLRMMELSARRDVGLQILERISSLSTQHIQHLTLENDE